MREYPRTTQHMKRSINISPHLRGSSEALFQRQVNCMCSAKKALRSYGSCPQTEFQSNGSSAHARGKWRLHSWNLWPVLSHCSQSGDLWLRPGMQRCSKRGNGTELFKNPEVIPPGSGCVTQGLLHDLSEPKIPRLQNNCHISNETTWERTVDTVKTPRMPSPFFCRATEQSWF